ncbi:MAG: FecR domain-containing protein [Polyangiaceae bacterium]
MSRGSVPPIQPTDLRDAASEERVERIWTRLEQDIVTLRARPNPRPSRTVVWALAATFAAFGVGVVSGRFVWRERPVGPSPVVATNDRAQVDVFAAGTQERTYALPGGGSVTLAPGSMIEMEHGTGSDVRLHLLAGEASLETAQGPDRGLAIVSGDATIATAPGSSISVRQRADNLDVRVNGGSAQVSSPAGTQSLGNGEQMENVPTRATTAANNPAPVVRVTPVGRRVGPNRPDAKAMVAVAPSWRELHAALKDDEAFDALRQQSGGVAGAISAAKSADELMALSDVLRFKRDTANGVAALRRVADEFGASANGATAAYLLSKHYDAAGQPDLAKKYRDQVTNGAFAAPALCDRMRAEQRAGRKDEAAARATEYLAKYPNGSCKDAAKSILDGSDAAEEDDSPARGNGASPDDVAPAVPAPSVSSSATASVVAPPAATSAPQK